MARSINDIKTIIINAKSNEADLAAYTSNSATQMFNLWAYIVAVAIWTLEVLFDKHKTEIDTKINNLIPGTLRWYYAQCLNFQYGDSLQWIAEKYQYAAIDNSKMIIKRAALREAAGQIRIKVCKESNNIPQQLTTNELNAFKAYMGKIKFAGTNLSIISYGACKVKFQLNLTYDPLVLTSAGISLAEGTNDVQISVENYLKTIVYGGVINRTKLIDAVQAVNGVVDIYIEDFQVKEANASNWSVISNQNYESVAGYYELDTLNLNSTANV